MAVQLPYTSRNGTYTVRYSGSFARYDTKFGLRVERSGYTFIVYVPGSANGRMTGLCGNNDGNATNDITLANGTYVGNRPNGPTLVGDSYIIYDDENPDGTYVLMNAFNSLACSVHWVVDTIFISSKAYVLSD